MASEILSTKKGSEHNGSSNHGNGTNGNRTSQHWPLDFEEAYSWGPGPYTAAKVWALLDEEPLELINGWLVWKAMTEPEERRVAGIIQEILSLAARFAHFGQAYPDMLDCKMVNGNILKPDVCVISTKRFETQVIPRGFGSESTVLKGSPEWVIENRSPSNRRSQEDRKRKNYFDSGAEIIWDVYHEERKIWVYEVENPKEALEYGEEDEISCERFLPGWKRKVADFFAKDLTAEEIVGEAAGKWRAETQTETLRSVLLLQARLKFGEAALPINFGEKLQPYTAAQLTGLVASITTAPALEDWLSGFPE